MDAALAAGEVVGAAGLGQGALDGVVDQFLVAVAAGAAVIELRDGVAVGVEAVGIDGGERADAAGKAQLPDEMPLEIETPLPPSTSGRTSIPPMRIALISFIGRALP